MLSYILWTLELRRHWALNWLLLVAKLFEKRGPWACKETASSKEKGDAGQCGVGGVVVVQLLSRIWLFVTHGLQQARLPYPSLSLGVCSNSHPLTWWCIQPSHPLSPPSSPALNLSQHQGLLQWVGFSTPSPTACPPSPWVPSVGVQILQDTVSPQGPEARGEVRQAHEG